MNTIDEYSNCALCHLQKHGYSPGDLHRWFEVSDADSDYVVLHYSIRKSAIAGSEDIETLDTPSVIIATINKKTMKVSVIDSL